MLSGESGDDVLLRSFIFSVKVTVRAFCVSSGDHTAIRGEFEVGWRWDEDGRWEFELDLDKEDHKEVN